MPPITHHLEKVSTLTRQPQLSLAPGLAPLEWLATVCTMKDCKLGAASTEHYF